MSDNKYVLAKIDNFVALAKHSSEHLERAELEVKQAIRHVEISDIKEAQKEKYKAKLLQARQAMDHLQKFAHKSEEVFKNTSLEIYEQPGDKLPTDANPELYRSKAGRSNCQCDSGFVSNDSRVFTDRDFLVAHPTADTNQFLDVIKIHPQVGLTDRTEVSDSDA